jgi:hypothetical protein
MNELLSEVVKALIAAAIPLLLTGLAWAFKLFREWLIAHTENLYLRRVEIVFADSVAYVGQVVADDLKAKSADGKLTDEEKQSTKQLAIDTAMAQLRDIPAKLIGDPGKRVEAELKKLNP